MNCFHANIHAHTHHHVHRTLYTIMFFFYDKLVVHMRIYTFNIACMYSLHTCSCIHSMFSVHASTYICASSMTTIDWCSMKCFHANIHAHTHQLVHITLSTIIVLFYEKLVVHMYIYTFTIACMYSLHECSCIHSMFLDRATTNISASSSTTDQCSINSFHASIHAHTHHHVHITLYTLTFFFYDKLVAHMCMYTFTISCMYSLHACSCIHSMFSVHASTNICASSTTTDRLIFQELFPCKYSCAYSSLCAQSIVHTNIFLL